MWMIHKLSYQENTMRSHHRERGAGMQKVRKKHHAICEHSHSVSTLFDAAASSHNKLTWASRSGWRPGRGYPEPAGSWRSCLSSSVGMFPSGSPGNMYYSIFSRAANDQSVLTIMEKAPTLAFTWLKAPTSAFTFMTRLSRGPSPWLLKPMDRLQL